MSTKRSFIRKQVLTGMLASCLAIAGYGQTLSVGTFNLRGDNATDVGNLWADRKLMVKAQIEKYQIDLLALQETLPSMAGYLKTAMPRFDTLSGVFTVANTGIMYNTERLLLENHGHFWLSPTPDTESIGWDAKFKRACVWAQLKDKKTGLDFYVFDTHFDHVGTVARTNSMVLVQQRIGEIAGTTPAIFLGDLNTSQYDSNYVAANDSGLLKDCYHLAMLNHERERGTGNGFDIYRRDRSRIDHIFLTQTLQATEYNVLTDTYNGKSASDHYAVMAKIISKYSEAGDLYRAFPEDFESPIPIKTSYDEGVVSLRTGAWLFSHAIIGGSSANDKPTSGSFGARMVNNNTTSCYLQMNFDVTEGASKVTIQHNTYAGDTVSKWQLEYSRDHGLSWAATGPVMMTNQTNKQQAIFYMDIPGAVRFRINKLGLGITNNGRLCLDDITIYKRKNSTAEKTTVPLLGWQFGTPLSTGRQDSATSSFTNPGVQVSVLKRGAGWHTTTSAGAPISLPGAFAAAATVASGDYAPDTSVAAANNLYLQFQVQPKPMYGLSLSSLDARLVGNKPGVKTWYWRYSLDGINYQYLAKPFEFGETAATSLSTINLAAYAELQHLSAGKTVYFRLYVNGVDADDEVIGIGTSDGTALDGYALSVNGTIETAPTTKLAAWQFATPRSTGGELTVAANLVDTAINAGPLARGAGLKAVDNSTGAPLALARAFVSVTSIPTTADIADTAIAVQNDMYFGCSLTVKQGYKVSLQRLNYRIRISGGGAKVWYWKYSLDGVNFTRAAMPTILTAATNDTGDMQPVIDLSGVPSLQDIPAGATVYFRLYTNGSNTTTGTTAIGRSALSTTDDYALSIEGSAEPVATIEKMIAWQFATPQKAGSETTVNATTLHSAITATPLVRGTGLSATSLARSFVALTTVATSAEVTDTVKAVASNLFFGFSFTPKAGKMVSLQGLDYKIRISGGGAKVWYWKYSLDGIHFSKVENPAVISAATDAEGMFMPHIDLSAMADLQNIPAGTTVYFRLYTNGSNNTTGSTAIGRSAAGSTEDVLWLSGKAYDVAALLAQAQRTALKEEAQIAGSDLQIWMANKQVSIVLAADKPAKSEFLLYDMAGRRLLAKSLDVTAGKNYFSIPVEVKTGVYIANVQTYGKPKISKKIFYGQ